jgi:hypothetical protein
VARGAGLCPRTLSLGLDRGRAGDGAFRQEAAIADAAAMSDLFPVSRSKEKLSTPVGVPDPDRDRES